MARTIDEAAGEQAGLEAFTDAELVLEVARRVARERHSTVDVIRALIELDKRRLYLGQGYSSLYAYCTEALHYSEFAAFNRIEVARAAARWPQLLTALEDGSLHLAGARLLAPHLTEENIESAIEEARHKSKRDIEEIAAGLAHRTIVHSLDAKKFRVELTMTRKALDTLRQIQALLTDQSRETDAGVLLEEALALLLKKVQKQRFGATDRPRKVAADDAVGSAQREEAGEEGDLAKPRPRHIANAVRRAVWDRDGGRCAFVGVQGRCSKEKRLEFHHLVPFAAGGRSTIANIELRCRQHNVYEAELYFGKERVAAARERRRSRRTKSAAGKRKLSRDKLPGGRS